MGQHRRGTLVILCLIVLAGVAGYERTGQYTSLADGASVALAATPKAPLMQTVRIAGEVNILGPWAGADLDSFRAVVQPFTQRTGVAVNLESTPDVAGILAARVGESAAPDIAILPRVSLLKQYAQTGCLAPLRRVVDVDRLGREYPAGWLDLLSVQGECYGLFYRVNNESVVWYDPAQFQRRKWTVPSTWQEMVALSEGIARSGLTPWSLGLSSRAAGGDAGTDWIENIVLRTAGPEFYDRWVRHEISWTDDAIWQAFVRWGQVVGRPRNLRSNPGKALQVDGSDALGRLYQEVPAAYLCLQGSVMQPFIAQRFPRRAAGKDVDIFPLPPLKLHENAPVLASADIIVMFNHTAQAEALMRYLASDEAQAIWVRRGGFIAPDQELNLAEYPDTLSRRMARQFLEAGTLRYDASDQMPPQVELAFRHAVQEFMANPGRLEAILKDVERVADSAYSNPSSNACSQPCWAKAASQATSSVSTRVRAWLARSYLDWPKSPTEGAPEGTPLTGTPEGMPVD